MDFCCFLCSFCPKDVILYTYTDCSIIQYVVVSLDFKYNIYYTTIKRTCTIVSKKPERNDNMNKRQTSSSVASKAAKVLSNPQSSKTAKSIAASALAQTKSPKKKG